jgi:hypothetical protein
MLKFPKTIMLAVMVSLTCGTALAGKYNLGREATQKEVSAWDIDVRPDGRGLPEGRGTVAQGEEIWTEKCADCHGDFGEGVDRWPVIAGGTETLSSDSPVKTVGSYWPYLSTVFDYINRAMPFWEARSLEPDEVYSLTAYILFLNDLVDDEEFELSKQNFLEKRLPNEVNFTLDNRLDTPVYNKFEPCIKNCKTHVKISSRARILDVTPGTEEDN